MTILEVRGQLYEFFSKNDIFEMDKNFDEIITISIDKDRDRAIVTQALQNFIENKIVEKAIHKTKTWWVLVQPLNFYPQTVQISRITISEIARVVNEYCGQNKDTENLVDILNIQDKDIKNVLSLLNLKSMAIKKAKDEENADE